MPIDWKLSHELNEVWHSLFWQILFFWQPKNFIFMLKKKGSNFCQKYKTQIFFSHFSLFFEKWQKMKNFQVRMPIDWKLSNELSEVWHSLFWQILLFCQPKNCIFMLKKRVQIFFKKTDCFEQLARYANDPHHFKGNIFFDQFSQFGISKYRNTWEKSSAKVCKSD